VKISAEWADAFEREIKRILGDDALKDIDQKHSLFKTIYNIKSLETSKRDNTAKLEGYTYNEKLVVVFTREGLNDTANTDGCCC